MDLEDYSTVWWDAPSIVGLVIFILCTFFIRYHGLGLWEGYRLEEGGWTGELSTAVIKTTAKSGVVRKRLILASTSHSQFTVAEHCLLVCFQ